MSIKFWNLILVVALLGTLAGGGYVLHQNHQHKQAEIQKAEQEAAELAAKEAEEEAKKQQQLKADFEDFLNNFLKNLYDETSSYKQRRTVLVGLVEPENLRAPEYVEENARLADSTVMAMQLQMDTVLGLFGQADERAESLIVRFDEGDREGLRNKWQELKETQSEKFMAFFAGDQEVLLAYRDLAEFYNEKRDVLEVDVANGRVILEAPEDQEQEALLRGKIIELQARDLGLEDSSQ